VRRPIQAPALTEVVTLVLLQCVLRRIRGGLGVGIFQALKLTLEIFGFVLLLDDGECVGPIRSSFLASRTSGEGSSGWIEGGGILDSLRSGLARIALVVRALVPITEVVVATRWSVVVSVSVVWCSLLELLAVLVSKARPPVRRAKRSTGSLEWGNRKPKNFITLPEVCGLKSLGSLDPRFGRRIGTLDRRVGLLRKGGEAEDVRAAECHDTDRDSNIQGRIYNVLVVG
jgi:hypothetical protein